MPTSITAAVDEVMARVFITVTAATGTTGTIQRVDTAGVGTPIRGADPATWQAGGFAGYDYEAPLDEGVTYQVLDTAGVLEATTGTVTVDSGGDAWLKNPGRPDLNVKVTVQNFPDLTSDLPQGIFQVIGSRFPVAVSSERWAEQGDLTIRTPSLTDRAMLKESLALGSTLLLQTPYDWGFGTEYVAVGQVTESRLVAYGPEPIRVWTLPLTVVEAPVGLASAGVGNSWNDVMATYPTWNDLMTAKASWNDLLQRVLPD